MEVDPISGNEVPPGSEPVEVRDDIDAKLSEGEYVIPADVVRYLGLDKIEKLVAQAKAGLEEMDAQGRIGGEEVVEEDDLPFSDEELLGGEAPIAMAVGGLVQPAGDRIISGMGRSVPTPPWMQDSAAEEPVQKESNNPAMQKEPASKWDNDVSEWTPEQFSQAVTQRNDIGTATVGKIASAIPFGGLMMQAKQRYVNKKAPEVIDKMLKSGLDAQGNTLTDQQKVDLAKAKEGLAATAKDQPGLMGLAFREAKGLISKKSPEQRAKEAADKAAKDKERSEKDKDKDKK